MVLRKIRKKLPVRIRSVEVLFDKQNTEYSCTSPVLSVPT